MGQFRYTTDGIRENNDLDENIYNAFIQFSPNDRSSVQAELRSNEFDHGDLTMLFDPSIHSDARQNDSAETLRVGGRRRLDNGDTLLGTFMYQEDRNSFTFGPISLDSRFYMHGADIQHIHAAPRWTRAQRHSLDEPNRRRLPLHSAAWTNESGRPPGFGLLVRGHCAHTPIDFSPPARPPTPIKDVHGDRSRIDPKLGVTWTANDALTLRAAAFKTLTYNLSTSKQNAQPRLEPTEIAGFNQFLFASNGDTATVYGLGLDGRLSNSVFAGIEVAQRDVEAQVIDASTFPVRVVRKPGREKNARSYFYWTPRPTVSFSARYEVGDFVANELSPYYFTEMKLRRLPLEAKYFGRSGLSAGMRVSHYHQEGEFTLPPMPGRETGTGHVLDDRRDARLSAAEAPRRAIPERRQLVCQGLSLSGHRPGEPQRDTRAVRLFPVHAVVLAAAQIGNVVPKLDFSLDEPGLT